MIIRNETASDIDAIAEVTIVEVGWGRWAGVGGLGSPIPLDVR